MKKGEIVTTAVLVIVVLLTAYRVYNVMLAQRRVIKSHTESEKKLGDCFDRDSSLIGRSILLNESDWVDFVGKERVYFRGTQSSYLFLIIVTKVSCGVCLNDFEEIFSSKNKNFRTIVLTDSTSNEAVKNIVNEQDPKCSVYVSKNMEWFKTYDLLVGPTSLLIDNRNNRVLAVNSPCGEESDIHRRRKFIEFISKLSSD